MDGEAVVGALRSAHKNDCGRHLSRRYENMLDTFTYLLVNSS